MITIPHQSASSLRESGVHRVHRDGRPRLSLVVVAADRTPLAVEGLIDLCARWERLGLELIIVWRGHRPIRSLSSGGRSGVHTIQGPDDANESRLREIGFGAATGDLVVLLDHPTSADDAWIEHLSGIGAPHHYTTEEHVARADRTTVLEARG